MNYKEEAVKQHALWRGKFEILCRDNRGLLPLNWKSSFTSDVVSGRRTTIV